MALSTVFYSINSPDISPLLCSSGLFSALLGHTTMYLFMNVSLSPDIILCGWVGLKHQPATSSCPRAAPLVQSEGWSGLIFVPQNELHLMTLRSYSSSSSSPPCRSHATQSISRWAKCVAREELYLTTVCSSCSRSSPFSSACRSCATSIAKSQGMKQAVSDQQSAQSEVRTAKWTLSDELVLVLLFLLLLLVHTAHLT